MGTGRSIGGALAFAAASVMISGCGGSKSKGPAAGSLWAITINSAAIKTIDPVSGQTWDAGGGAPDPFVTIKVGTNAVEQSPTVADSFSPAWNYTFAGVYTYASLGDVLVTIWDEDVSANDVIYEFGSSVLQPAGSSAETINATGDSTTGFDNVSITISPL